MPTSERLGKRERIARRRDFVGIQDGGWRVPGKVYTLMIRAGEGETSRLGVTVSKKVGGAVVRNRVKRWIRESYRREKGRLRRATDVVVIARPEAARAGFSATRAELAKLLDRAATRRS